MKELQPIVRKLMEESQQAAQLRLAEDLQAGSINDQMRDFTPVGVFMLMLTHFARLLTRE